MIDDTAIEMPEHVRQLLAFAKQLAPTLEWWVRKAESDAYEIRCRYECHGAVFLPMVRPWNDTEKQAEVRGLVATMADVRIGDSMKGQL
jgi:hypothetical protein